MSDDYDNVDDSVSEEADSPVAAEAEVGSSEERAAVRVQLEADIEAFLAKGGKITSVAANVMADPPKKPQSNYGGQPI